MRILVTGATGFLGSHVAEELARQGHDLRLLVRRTSKLGFLDGVVFERVIGDVRDAGSLAPAVDGVETIVHVAGLTAARGEAEFQAVNTEGTAALVAAASVAGVRRFVYVSSLAAQGPSDDGEVKPPESPPNFFRAMSPG